MYRILIHICVLCFVTLVSCKDKKSNYEGCCGTEPTKDAFFVTISYTDIHGNLVDTMLKAGVYIPNIFIIDNSGENNILNVFGSESVNKVSSVIFTDENGVELFSRANVLPNDPAAGGWDGSRPDGTVYKGSFNYEVVVEFIDGQQKTYLGKACAYHCDDEGFPDDNLPNCAFPSQHDGNGGWDPALAKSDYCF